METISLQGQEISELILESTAPWDNQLCFEAYGYEWSLRKQESGETRKLPWAKDLSLQMPTAFGGQQSSVFLGN